MSPTTQKARRHVCWTLSATIEISQVRPETLPRGGYPRGEAIDPGGGKRLAEPATKDREITSVERGELSDEQLMWLGRS